MTVWFWLLWTLSGLLALAGATLLYFALLHDRPKGRRRCPRCWYDMAGTPGLICPECGRTARRERSLRHTRRKWWRAALAAAILALAYTAGVTPRVLKTGKWWTAIPRPLLILVIQFYDDDQFTLLKYVGNIKPQSNASSYYTTALIPNEEAESAIHATALERLLLARRCAAILDDPTSPPPPPPAPPPVTFPLSSSVVPLADDENPFTTAAAVAMAMGGSTTAPPAPLNRFERHDIAVRVLAKLGPQAWPASQSLLRALQRAPDHSDLSDALANAAMGSRSVSVALGRYARTDPNSRGDIAMSALAKAGASGRAARDDIVQVLYAPADGPRARAAARALASICAPDDCLDIMSKGLNVASGRTRVGVIHALGLLTSRRDKALSLLIIAAHDTTTRCPADCVRAIVDLGGPGALNALVQFVSEPDADLAAESAAALWSFGPAAAPAVPALTRAIAGNDVNLRNHATAALGFIGADAEPARPAIEAMLTDPDPRMRAAAADALRLMRQPPRRQYQYSDGNRHRRGAQPRR